VGDNGQSFVVGAGKIPQQNLTTETRFVPCKNHSITTVTSLGVSIDQIPTFYTVLSSGPGKPDDKYVDNRNDYMCQVATDYNALYTVASTAAAGLDDAFWSSYKTMCPKYVPKYNF
jgi:hypothetical protein